MATPPRRPPNQTEPSAMSNGYTAEEGRRLAAAGANATEEQLCLALDLVVDLFRVKNLTSALMGGLALSFRGSTRDTHDVDIAVAPDMSTLRQSLLGDSRIKIPIGPVSGVMRVFVHVGPQYGEPTREQCVQVDMLLRGSLGAPDDLSSTTEIVSVNTVTGTKEYVVINLLHHCRSKLGAFATRNEPSDLEDLRFMCIRYPEQVEAFRDELSLAHRQHFVREYVKIVGEGPTAEILKDILAVEMS